MPRYAVVLIVETPDADTASSWGASCIDRAKTCGGCNGRMLKQTSGQCGGTGTIAEHPYRPEVLGVLLADGERSRQRFRDARLSGVLDRVRRYGDADSRALAAHVDRMMLDIVNMRRRASGSR